jgi:hypothetical protein
MSTRFTQSAIAVALGAVFGVAFAQSTPPNSAVTNPPVGAGQQSSQGTPMGTTGTPGATAGKAAPATTGAATASGSGGTTASGTGMSAGASGTTSMAAAGESGKPKAAKAKRKAKADRG